MSSSVLKSEDATVVRPGITFNAMLDRLWNLNSQVVLGLLLWTQVVFLASTFRSWLPMLSAAFLATLLVVARSRFSRGQSSPARAFPRWLSWLLLFPLFLASAVVIAFWRIGSQIGEDLNPVYVGVDIIAHAALVIELIVWPIHPRRGHVSLLTLGLIVVLLSVAAGGASVSLAAQTAVALTTCLGFTIGSQIILGASKLRGPHVMRGSMIHSPLPAGTRDPNPESSAWLAPLFSLLTLSVLMMSTSVIANATNYVLPAIQAKLHEQLKATLDVVGEQSVIGGTRYVHGGRLGSIRRHMMGNPREVALQVYCDVPPGYLRGHVFDLYRNGRWLDSGSAEILRYRQRSRGERDHSILPSGTATTLLKRDIRQVLQRFPFVDPSPEPTITLEVHNDPLKGPMVFLPLTTHWLEARSGEIAVTQHGAIRLGVDVTRPYVAGVCAKLPRQDLSDETRLPTLDVSNSQRSLVSAIAQRLCRPTDLPRAKAAAISDYFQSEYGYSMLGIDLPQGVDPLNHFLESGHDAHCEFFASATVLMLRSVGVPARYVTGYVADEISEDESGLWLARNQDAHAWVEAFDDVSGQWFPVESTPGRRYQTIVFESELDVDDSILGGLFDRSGDDGESWLSLTFGWLGSIRASDALLVVFRFTQLPLFLVLAYVLWTRYLRPSDAKGDPIEILSRKMLRQADRRLRKHALARRPSETLYQFADRIEQIAAGPSYEQRVDAGRGLVQTAHWYREFANARYQGRLPEPLA